MIVIASTTPKFHCIVRSMHSIIITLHAITCRVTAIVFDCSFIAENAEI